MLKRWRLSLVVFLVLLLFSPPLAALTPPTVRVQGSSSKENVEFVGQLGGSVASSEVRVDPDYDESTPGWGVTRFSTIQDGVDAVSSGGTVNVGAGTYYETVVMDKSLSLEGEDAETVLLDAEGVASCILVSDTTDVSISGFTLTGSKLTDTGGYEYPAADLRNVDNAVIADNVIFGVGIRLSTSHQNTITNNLLDCHAPIMIFGSRDNRIESNQIHSRKPQGIGLLHGSNGNVVLGNTLLNSDHPQVSCTGIRVVHSEANLIKDNTLDYYRAHILLTGADHNTVSGNSVTRSWDPGDEWRDCGLIMYSSCHNLVINNSVSSVAASGIRVFGASVSNTFQANRVEDAGHAGIDLHYGSTENDLVNNQVSGSAYGIILDGVSQNVLRENALVHNSQSAFDNGDNTWDGNYYSDYEGTDSGSDGIGDSPYLVSPSGIDDTPLIEHPEIVTVEPPDLGPTPTAPEPIGWLMIDTAEVWEEETLIVEKGITIKDGGSLTVRNSTVQLLHEIWVEEGGTLILENTDLTVDVAHNYFLRVMGGGTLMALDSRISGKGHDILVLDDGRVRVENSELYWLGGWDGSGALEIYADDALIKNNLIVGSYTGINVRTTSADCQVVGNTITGGGDGISSFVTNITEPISSGILIEDNVISRMLIGGIAGMLADGTVVGNTFQDIWGPSITFEPASPEQSATANSIYENSFINCGAASDDGEDNVWYSEDESRGNYWSDYRERYPYAEEHPEHTGIWDTPYAIGTQYQDEAKQDIYPLMHAPVLYYRSLEVTAPDTVELIFSQNIYNALASEDELKSEITFAPDAATYTPLGESDFVSISPDKLIITFAEELSGNMNRIRIGAGSLEDESGTPIDYDLRIAEFGFDEGKELFLPLVQR